MSLVSDETLNERRSLLTWSTFDAIPAGQAFSRSLAAQVARVNRTSDLALSNVDWTMVERWASGERARELDRALAASGRHRWTVFVRAAAGQCVGGTEVTFEPSDRSVVFQQNTGIDPAHRRLGLAKWAKATVLKRIRYERPDVRRVRTGNAFSNAPMLAINNALGFKVVSTCTDWQAEVGDVRRGSGRKSFGI